MSYRIKPEKLGFSPSIAASCRSSLEASHMIERPERLVDADLAKERVERSSQKSEAITGVGVVDRVSSVLPPVYSRVHLSVHLEKGRGGRQWKCKRLTKLSKS